MGAAGFSREQASALADLQFHWDERYVIAFDGDVWSARWRRTGGDELTASSAEDLRQLIREDHARRRHDDYVGLRERMST